MKTFIQLILSVLAVCFMFFQQSCLCEEKVGFQIVRGNLSEAECARVLQNADADIDLFDDPKVSIVCPGEPCTICYGKSDGTNQASITSDNGSISQTTSSNTGVINFNAEETMEITMEALDGCAKEVVGTVYVLKEATNVPITAQWDGNGINCENITFELSETFISPDVFAIEVMAAWDDDLIKKLSLEGECTPPPFLTLFRNGDLAAGSHAITQTNMWEKLPRGWKAAGNYSFTPEFLENCRKNCDLRIDFPFYLYVSCDPEEPYRQP